MKNGFQFIHANETELSTPRLQLENKTFIVTTIEVSFLNILYSYQSQLLWLLQAFSISAPNKGCDMKSL